MAIFGDGKFEPNGSGSVHDEKISSVPIPDLNALRIIPRHPAQHKYWVVVGTHIKGFANQADAEADAILSARSYPGQTIRVTKTVKAFRTKEPAVETLESE
jgi:hypothetical protein